MLGVAMLKRAPLNVFASSSHGAILDDSLYFKQEPCADGSLRDGGRVFRLVRWLRHELKFQIAEATPANE
jgi:hypothetical protein